MSIIWQSTKLILIEMPWFAIVRCKCMSYLIPGKGPEIEARKYSCRLAQFYQWSHRRIGYTWEIIGYVHKTHTTFCIGGNTVWVQNSRLHNEIKTFFHGKEMPPFELTHDQFIFALTHNSF